MIRIVLLGRTGNNLFQYALGRVLSKIHNTPLILDASWYNREGWSEVSHFLNLQRSARVRRTLSLPSRALRRMTGKHPWEFLNIPIIREAPDDLSYQSKILDAPADCVLFGYFQTFRYFESIEGELRDEINNLLARSMQHAPTLITGDGTETVAVHVRRGDFLKHPLFQVCDLDYYQKAMRSMRCLLQRPKFFIFSDDPGWCRDNFRDEDSTVVDSSIHGNNPLPDLYTMSRASHHIISNSSYSWWAAWLGKKSGQQVIIPDRWFANQINAPIQEKLCPGWTAMEMDHDSRQPAD